MQNDPASSSGRPLFFTSVPKAGKNLIYTFLGTWDYQRADLPREAALAAAEAPWLAQTGHRATYALGADNPHRGDHVTKPLQEFLDGAAALPEKSVTHHHFPHVGSLAERLRGTNLAVVFVYRDPRDILLSMADYILNQSKPAHLAKTLGGLGRPKLVERLWQGDRELLPFPDYLGMFAGWREEPGVLGLRFESLIGESGGGTSAEQTVAVEALAASLRLPKGTKLAQAQARIFNARAGTFFKGQAGRWRYESAPEIRAILASSAMSRLTRDWDYP